MPGFSSKFNQKSEIVTQIPGSHEGMVKFSERSDTGFVEMKNALQRWTNAIQNEERNGKPIPWAVMVPHSLTARQSFGSNEKADILRCH